jgi:hypothetical protein
LPASYEAKTGTRYFEINLDLAMVRLSYTARAEILDRSDSDVRNLSTNKALCPNGFVNFGHIGQIGWVAQHCRKKRYEHHGDATGTILFYLAY